jgi:hypothetical protein
MKKGLNDIEKFCLCGYFLTKDADTAYKLSRKRENGATPENVHRLALRWVRSQDAKEYLESIAAVHVQSVKGKAGENRRSKEDIIRELNVLATSVHDPKQRTEILLKLADLERMKDEPSQEEAENNTVHYYVPLNYPTSCKDCAMNPSNPMGIKMDDELKKKSRFF